MHVIADMAEVPAEQKELTAEKDVQKALALVQKQLALATEAASGPATTASSRKTAEACLVAKSLLQTLPGADALKAMPSKVFKTWVSIATLSMQLLGRPGAITNGQPSDALSILLQVLISSRSLQACAHAWHRASSPRPLQCKITVTRLHLHCHSVLTVALTLLVCGALT